MRILITLLLALNIFAGVGGAAAAETLVLLPGTPYATEAYVLRGDAPGPAAVVLGGAHGNEPAGAVAAQTVAGFRPANGTLIVIPRLNKLALEQDVRTLPEIGDINRAYPGRPDGTPAERLAAAVDSLIAAHRATLLIDCHEARTFHRQDRTSLGQMVLFAANDKSAVMALDAIEHINAIIHDPVKKFDFGAHPIPGSAAHYAGRLGLAAFTLETSGRQPIDERVAQHVTLVRFLLEREGLSLK